MSLYSLNGAFPQELPDRIRLSNGTTRTNNSTFTSEEIASAGYVKVDDKPTCSNNQIVYWSMDQIKWLIRDKTEEDLLIEKNQQIHKAIMHKNMLLQQVDQFLKDVASGTQTSYTEENLNSYKQSILDTDIETDPFKISWPIYGSDNKYSISL